MEARYYQSSAIETAWEALRRGADPVIQLPTGSGKSFVIAELSRRIIERGGRVLNATHSMELVGQNAAEFQRLTGIEPGVLCAGLERTDKGHDVLFASVQSIHRPAQRGEIPPFDLIQIDECHLVANRDSKATFYPTLFKSFPESRRVGYSATPSRNGIPVWGDHGFFSERCYEVSVLELVHEGFLSPLVGVNTSIQLDIDKLKTVAGEFDQRSAEEQETDAWLLAVTNSVKELAVNRQHIAVFCPTVKVAQNAARIFSSVGLQASSVAAETSDRDEQIVAWKSGAFPVMTSVNILSTGFNFPALDTIVCIRPTKSVELWQQILGRATRIAPGKKNALLLDYSGNLSLHGGICAGIEEVYEQKATGEVIRGDAKPKPPKRKINSVKELTDLDPMMASPRGVRVKVKGMTYLVIKSGSQPGKRLVMVSYNCELGSGATVSASDFLMGEYTGFAFEKTKKWFNRRGVTDFPYRADTMQQFCYSLPEPREVTIRKNGKYINVVEEYF